MQGTSVEAAHKTSTPRAKKKTAASEAKPVGSPALKREHTRQTSHLPVAPLKSPSRKPVDLRAGKTPVKTKVIDLAPI